ncbi:MAG: PSD1 domain-containing protein [Planctomycetes bacterium]|nr:PSD1 domain-containing protein [Planctomycetota bacterium]
MRCREASRSALRCSGARLSGNAATLAVGWLLGACAAGLAQTPDRVDFSRDVLPILSKNCFPCHGPDEQARKAELRLDTREGALRTSNPVIRPGNSAASELVRRISRPTAAGRMPPARAKRQLNPNEIRLLRRWVDEGAVWSEHWAFQTPQRPKLPRIRDSAWPRNAIDTFVRARLESQGLQPSPEATKEVLLRRVTLDLIGLPPTPDERAAFLADNSSTAYDRVVDRLLASPQYGERWGRHWLDAARYADSDGFEGDAPRTVWKYRDWVIAAMNDDLPFDQFTIKQLASDLLPAASTADRIATGFLLNSPQDGRSEPARLDAVVERVNTLGSVFLGLTLGCAQCHAHKFDPLSQREYYQLFAFVNAADEFLLEFAPAEQLARRDALKAQLAALVAERDAYVARRGASKAVNDVGYQERSRTIDELKAKIPHIDSALVLTAPATPRPTRIFVRGEYTQPGATVTPDVPQCLPPLPRGARTRLELARWLVSPQQPLTPRVTVNRIWQQFFGRGLVETENDFGTQGARPTHPELLDWLATEFVRQGWRLKALHRLIVGSATYRQASHRRADLERIDPENRLLARQSRLRLEAEVIRDAVLATSGLLSTKIGGPSVFPFQHDGIMLNRATPAPWIVSPGADRFRRGMYTHYWRLTPHPQLQTFDAPDTLTACTRRRPSNTPLQALTLLNDPTFVECAESLARRLIGNGPGTDNDRIDRAFRLCLGRTPVALERKLLTDVLTTARARFAASNAKVVERAAWTQVTRVLINLDEFITRE